MSSFYAVSAHIRPMIITVILCNIFVTIPLLKKGDYGIILKYVRRECIYLGTRVCSSAG